MANRKSLVNNSGTISELSTSDSLSVPSLTFGDGTIQLTSAPSNTRSLVYAATDFLSNTATDQSPFVGSAIASGGITNTANTGIFAGHPGICLIRSSTTANSGFRFNTGTDGMLLQGNEQYDIVFYSGFVSTGTTIRLGFCDSTGASVPVDGALIEIIPNSANTSAVASGKNYNNSSTTSATSTGSLTANTWYHGRVLLDATASLVTYTIYTMNGTQVWSDTLSTNIPKTSGRQVGCGVWATDSGTTAIDLINLDFMSIAVPSLIRGAI